MDSDTARAILAAYNRRRGPSPAATRISARRNRRTLASVRRLRSGAVRLNVAHAVVQAGPEAWSLLGPALQRDPVAREALARLCRSGLEAARTDGRQKGHRTGVRGRARPLADTPCQGTTQEQEILRLIIDWATETKGHGHHFPEELQVRVSRRMSSRYGTHMVRGGMHRITISHRLFRAGLEDVLLDTVLHELAHLLDARTHPRGRSFHDASWKGWCRRLGATPERLVPGRIAPRVASAQGRAGPGALPDPVTRWLRRSLDGCGTRLSAVTDRRLQER